MRSRVPSFHSSWSALLALSTVALALGGAGQSRAATVTGRLVDERGEPVAQARVVLIPVVGVAGEGRPEPGFECPEAESRSDGTFEVAAGAGIYRLAVLPERHLLLVRPGLEVGGAGRIDVGTIALADGSRVRGRVLDPEGRPVPGARVTVGLGEELGWDAPTDLRNSAQRQSVADDAGRFDLAGLPRKPLEISARAEGWRWVEAGVMPPAEGLEPRLRAAGRLRVLVRNPDGGSVSGAQAFPEPVGRLTGYESYGTTAEPGGQALVGKLEPGKWRLWVEAPGHRSAYSSIFELGTEGREVQVVLEPVPTRAVTVVVMNLAGRPVEGAEIELGTERGEPELHATRSTGVEGQARIERVPLGSYSLSVRHAEYEELRVRGQHIDPSTSQIALIVAPRERRLVTIQGRVLGPNGPVAGAEVQARGPEHAGETAADELGRFSFGPWPTATYEIEARSPHLATARAASDGGAGVELRMVPGSSVWGRLSGWRADELGRLTVRAQLDGEPGDWRTGWVTNEGGYRVDGLGPGRWRIAVSGGWGRRAFAEVTIAAGLPSVEMPVELHSGRPVGGRVRAAGTLPRGLQATLWEVGNDPGVHPEVWSSRLEPDGRFRFEGVTARQALLALWADRNGRIFVEDLDLAMGPIDDLDLRFEGAPMAGRVVDSVTGDSVPAASVQLSLLTAQHSTAHDHPCCLTADEAGGFATGPLEAGIWQVSAEAPGYVPAEIDVEIAGGRAVTARTLQLQPTPGLELVVHREGGAPPPDMIHLYLHDEAGEIVAQGAFSSYGEARLHWATVPVGRWLLTAKTSYGSRTEAWVEVPGEPVEIELPAAGLVRAGIAGGAPEGLQGACLTLTAESGFSAIPIGVLPGSVCRWRTGWDGRFRARGIPPGIYEARITHGDSVWAGPVTVRDGEVAEVELRESGVPAALETPIDPEG